MVGKGRHPILGVRSVDPILSLVAPLGLAASAGTALVVDLVSTPGGWSGRTVADLVADGPMLSELSPGRQGLALIPGGRVDHSDAVEVLDRLASRWPAVVVRVADPDWPFPCVPVVPLYPGRLAPAPVAAAGVWQPVTSITNPPGPGPVLPRLRPGLTRRLLSGHLPRRARWISSWTAVWEMPWA